MRNNIPKHIERVAKDIFRKSKGYSQIIERKHG